MCEYSYVSQTLSLWLLEKFNNWLFKLIEK